MNTNKLKNFAKQYGFYLAVGVISVGAVTAVYIASREEQGQLPVYAENGTVKIDGDVSNPEYVDPTTQIDLEALESVEEDLSEQNESVEEPVVQTDTTDTANTTDVEDANVADEATQNSEEVSTEEDQAVEDETVETEPMHTNQEMIETEYDAIASETFNSTTSEPEAMPFFAEGDKMNYPVEGEIIVPYTDDTTKHWTSTALNQTMRTYGICIAAKEGTPIKAPADGTVIDIVADATSIEWYKRVGNVGKIMILDHGNGYQTQIGLQGGEPDQSLLGKRVSAGTTLATVGKATGPFVDLESNVYMQVRKGEEIVNPTTFFEQPAEIADSVDMGHAED